MTEQHRARTRLFEATKVFRWFFDIVQDARRGGCNWPPYIFVPLIEVYEAAMGYVAQSPELLKIRGDPTDSFIKLFYSANMWAAWRGTQGIYRFHPQVYQPLIDTPMEGDIPADVLKRLPEWAIYVETPGLSIPSFLRHPEMTLYGVWAKIDVGLNGREMLTLIVDKDDKNITDRVMPLGCTLYLDMPSVESAISKTVREKRNLGGRSENYVNTVVDGMSAWVKPVVNLLLFICTQNDFSRDSTTSLPQNPVPKKTKRGMQIFVPEKATTWDVGVRFGNAIQRALRDAVDAPAPDEGGTKRPRPHIRRAHWHGYRSGARLTPDGQPIPAEARRFDLRWLAPIPVKIDLEDGELPAVIHPVKK